MTYAEQASVGLKQKMEAIYRAVYPLTTAWGKSLQAMRGAAEIEAVIVASTCVIRDMEALAAALKVQIADARDAVGETILETGAPPLDLDEAHEVTMAASSAPVIITDAKKIPSSLMRPARPDLDKIGSMLRAGRAVIGAILGNKPPPHLVIRKKKI